MMKPQKRFFLPSATVRTERARPVAATVVPRHPLRSAVAPTLRLAQRMPTATRGLAIGYGFPEDFTLPGWGLILSDKAPPVDLQSARRLANVAADTSLLLIANGGPAVKTVFATFIANNTEHVSGAAFFGDTYPTDGYALSLWVHLAEKSAARKGLRLLTDLRNPDKSLSAILGTAQAPAEGGPKDETPFARIARLLSETFGPESPKMPVPVPPVEHLKEEA